MLKIIAVTIFIIVNLVFIIIYPELKYNYINLFAVFLFALTFSNLILTPSFILAKHSDAGRIGSVGPTGFFNLILFLWASLTIYYTFFNHPSFSFASNLNNLTLVMSLITVALFIIFYAAIKLISHSIDETNKEVEYKSEHNKWKIKLSEIVSDSSSDKIGKLINELAEKSNYLSRDKKSINDSINIDINSKIDYLKENVENLDESIAIKNINEIKILFDKRENLIRNSNSKA